MSKRLKGLYQSSKEIKQPQGFYSDSLNINIDEKLGAIINEKGTNDLFSILGNNINNPRNEIGIFDSKSSIYNTLYFENLTPCQPTQTVIPSVIGHILLSSSKIVIFFTCKCQ